MRFVFLSEGDLYLKEDGKDAVPIESHFAREAEDRATARRERNDWKTAGDNTGNPFGSRVVWGRQAEMHRAGHPVMAAVAAGPATDELVYALSMSASAGLFRYNLTTREEYRLFHRQDFEPCGLCCDRRTGGITVASRNHEHLGKLQLVDDASRRRDTLTDGDGHDTNPSPHLGKPGVLLLQSCGVGRDERGEIVALGPASILELHLETGRLETILADDHWDYLLPKTDAAGNLHFIRRPFAARDDLPLGQKLKAFALVPVHLAGALFGFLDAFARMFGQQSLRPAAGGPKFQPRSRFATFQDTTVQLEKVLKGGGEISDDLQVVPKTWELVRRTASGDESVVARHVVAYDLGPQGELVYSDGLRVWLDGAPRRKLHQGHIIQSVVVA